MTVNYYLFGALSVALIAASAVGLIIGMWSKQIRPWGLVIFTFNLMLKVALLFAILNWLELRLHDLEVRLKDIGSQVTMLKGGTK